MKWLLCTAAFLLSAIIAPAQADNVVYEDSIRQNAKLLSFFVDRAGDLYPPGDVSVDDKALRNRDLRRPFNRNESPDYATLRALYRWEWANRTPRWRALAELSATPLTPDADFDQAWSLIQQVLRAKLTADLKALRNRHVMLLVHGFNNDFKDATAWYAKVEESIAAQQTDVAFVRMYWDGLSDMPLKIWGEAQYNGPSVGLGLRRILNQLPSNYPLRVFTHSSGAFVMTNALGDGSGAFNPKALSEEYVLKATGAPDYEFPKLDDLRLAMLVPAQPTTAYRNFKQGQQGAVPARIILGTSPKDFATTKFFRVCRMAGATCMAVKPQQACADVQRDLGVAAPRVSVVNFPASHVPLVRHDHDVPAYMRDSQWKDLLEAMLGDTLQVTDDTRRFCFPSPAA
ncbi:alpha/beta hydrolase [Pseudomonas sp. CGJS7]|uniref:alpha/beta hydrolase n=1 Tax=Pseudomonas sp. CGJS7 TaxID=3109348 RepID=UPI00300BE0E6